MGLQSNGARRSLAPRFVLGVASGLLIGLLTSLSPVVAIAVILMVFVATVVRVVRRADPVRSMMLAGTMVGAGAFLTYGAINTVAACRETDDFCGNANVTPFVLLAVVTIIFGGVAAAIVAMRSSRQGFE